MNKEEFELKLKKFEGTIISVNRRLGNPMDQVDIQKLIQMEKEELFDSELRKELRKGDKVK